MGKKTKEKNKIIVASTIPTSLNTFYYGMLSELSKRYEVVGMSSPGATLDEVKKREGIRTIGIPMERHISIFRDLKALWSIYKIIRKERPTIVHSITPKAGLLCMIASWLNNVPIRIHTFTGLVFPTSTGLKRRILMMTDSITCSCSTNIIPEGEGVKNDLLNYGITKKDIKVLGFGNLRGVDMKYYSRRPEVIAKSNLIRNDNLFTFLFVGRIVKDKGINELVSAFCEVYEKHPDTRLVLVGEYESSLDPISVEAQENIKGHPAIEAVGPQYGDDLLAYYASSDCFAFPSYREGFPNTVLEAGALGLPSIVTDINGSREIIIEGINGTIIPSKDKNALVEAMNRMVEDKEYLNRLASSARKMIGDRYEQTFVRKCQFDFYEECLIHST